MKNAPAYSIGESFLTITFLEDGRNFIINKTQEAKRFNKCIEMIQAEDWQNLRDYLSPTEFIKTESGGDITIHGNVIKYKDMLVDNVVADKIIECVRKDLPYKNLAAFLKNLLEGMDKDVLRELYLYLENAKSMPILQDGSFLAYRYVNEDYTSCHQNPDGSRNRNMVGDVVTMDRAECDSSRDRTCSRGLHFCSYEYLPSYTQGNRIMIVKVFPQDVVAIPKDHNNQKARCCKYEVVGEVDRNKESETKLPEEECNKEAREVAQKLDSDESVDFDLYTEFTQAEYEKVIEILERRAPIEVRKASKVTKPYINVDKFLAVVDVSSQFTYEPTEPKSKTIIKQHENRI